MYLDMIWPMDEKACISNKLETDIHSGMQKGDRKKHVFFVGTWDCELGTKDLDSGLDIKDSDSDSGSEPKGLPNSLLMPN